MTGFPDPDRSRVVLVGCSRFPSTSNMPEIPAVRGNLASLRAVFTDPDAGVLAGPAQEHCRVIYEPETAAEIGAAIERAAAEATDMLLVYYAGHGLVDDQGRLYLASTTSEPGRLRYTALPVALLREDIAASAATSRVLILDCCFSGRAIEAMSDSDGLITGQINISGTYTLTSTSANAPSHALLGESHTAFTGALLQALGSPDPLSLDEIYIRVDRSLAERGLPRPQRRATNAAGNLCLARGAAKNEVVQSTSEPIQFVRDRALLAKEAKETFSFFGWIGFFVGLILGGVDSLGKHLSIHSAVIHIAEMCVVTAVPTIVLIGLFVLSNISSADASLVIGRSGISMKRKTESVSVPWRHIANVGVMRPKPGLAKRFRERNHTLVVRLRPDAPKIEIHHNALSYKHRELGYIGLCKVGTFGASPADLAAALEPFAGDRLVRSPEEFLELDPRLRSDMV